MIPQKIITVPEGKLMDYVDGKIRSDTPEEYVRQTIEHRLVEEHEYSKGQIFIEFGLKIGSKKPRADIVVFDKNSEQIQDNVKIIIECKQEKITASSSKDGVAQLKSYMTVCPNCEWGMWTNSVQKFVYRKIRDKAGQIVYEEYNDIPSADGNIAEIDRPTRPNLKNAADKNLLFAFKICHNHIYANDGLHKDKAFFEFLKIIFCKIADERNVPKPLEFFATSGECNNPDGQLTVKNRIAKIFERVKKNYRQIFEDGDEINLTARSLSRVVRELQKYSFLNTNIDIKGKAYEEIVGANLRGDRGEFFTPRNIMKMVVDMLEPSADDTVLDSSCGTGGFLVCAMTYVIRLLEKQFAQEYGDRANWNDDIKRQLQDRISEIAQKNYFGFDLNPDLVKATKMNMVMNNDGSGNILQTNSLLPPHEWTDEFKNKIANAFDIEVSALRDYKKIGLFDIVVTNPPFGSKIPIDDAHVLKQFELAHIWNFDAETGEWNMTDAFQKSVPPEILFVERCTQFLKPGGRIGIILPDSILGSPGLGYIRTWIIQNHKILASLDLHADTFQPHNGTQTSVLILQKKTPDEIADDYDIFMARVDKVGHDKRGNMTPKRDLEGNEILDENKEPIVDDETADVAKTYLNFKKKIHYDDAVRFCTVKLSEVKAGGLRLEAGVYDEKSVTARQSVENGKFPAIKLSEMITAYYPNRFKRVYCNRKFGEPFYLPSQMNDVYPKTEKFISHATEFDLSELRLRQNTLVLTRSGTIGNVAYVSRTLTDKIYSDDVIRILCNNDFDAGYIYIYLKSKVGNDILLTNSYGAVIQHINPEHLENIPIPDAPENLKRKIHELVVKSYALRDESNDLIDQATQILIDELQLPDIEDFPDEKFFTVNVKNLFGRLDVSYHAPIVGRIVEHLKKHAAEVTTIGDSRISKNIILAGVFKRVYVDKEFGYPFLGGSEIGQLNPVTEKFLSKKFHHERYEKELRVSKNMILVTDRGTVGKVALVPEHWNGYAVSQNVLKVIPAGDNIAGYIYIWLNTDFAKKLITREIYGAVVDMIDARNLSIVPVPLLKNSVAQEQINSLALLANEKRYKAYTLEQEALKIFEEEIL